MADGTTIEWTKATWNIVTGCSVISPGCANCYAMRLAGTRLRKHFSRSGLTQESKAGPVWNGDTRVNWEWIDQPLSWSRPREIFVAAHGDLFHEGVAASHIALIYGVMIAAHHLRKHNLQVLTKRIERAQSLLTSQDFWDIANAHAEHLVSRRTRSRRGKSGSDEGCAAFGEYGPRNPPPGIWIGTSVEDQRRADERVPLLLRTPAALRWLSCEPLLGPVDLTSIKAPREPDEPEDSLAIDRRFDALEVGDHYWFDGENGQPGDCGDGPYRDHRIDWVVAGGESGPGARPMHPDWARSLRDQCARATLHGDDAPVPFFFKQWGAWISIYDRDNDDPEWRAVPTPGDWDKKRWLNLAGGQGFHGDKLHMMRNVGKKAAGNLLDFALHEAMPEVAHG